MKIGIVIGSNDAELAWNALRFGNAALKAGHNAKAFLMNSGVEIEGIKSEKYDVGGQLASFVGSGGKMLACGTCLKNRNEEGSPVCPISTMQDLLKMVEESDRVLTFG